MNYESFRLENNLRCFTKNLYVISSDLHPENCKKNAKNKKKHENHKHTV